MPGYSITRFKEAVPWFVKIPAKIVLSRLPISQRTWQKLNLFRAGIMDAPREAFVIFNKHLESTGLGRLDGRTVLELGPGNGTLTALFAKALGATRTWLVDAQELASQDAALFEQAAQMLLEAGFTVPDLRGTNSTAEILERLNAIYLTKGLESLKTIPSESVDFLFSNAVLEHIRLADFSSTVREVYRILSPNGAASHQIDFRDHLQNALNNLRFSQRLWESSFMVHSGFYTNRIPWPEMKQTFEDAGFAVEVGSCQRWPGGLPTRQKSMALPFKNLSEDQLMVMGAKVVLRRPTIESVQLSLVQGSHRNSWRTHSPL